MKKIFAIITLILLIALSAFVFDWGRKESKIPEIKINATSTEVTSTNMPIVVSYPTDGQTVTSPIKITGKARGNWFFEASFPIQLVDSNGNIIATSIGTAQSDWMTTDFVNFTSTIEYNRASSTGNALLVLNKDNPSGNPEFDQSIFIPVVLK